MDFKIMREVYMEIKNALLFGKTIADMGIFNIRDDQGKTLLHLACDNGDVEFVKLLVQNGANINAIDNYRITPIFTAVSLGFKQIVEFLIQQNGIDPNIATKKGLTVLHAAVILDNYSILMMLLNSYKVKCLFANAILDCFPKGEDQRFFEKISANPFERCIRNECYVNFFILIGYLFKKYAEKIISPDDFNKIFNLISPQNMNRLEKFCNIILEQKIYYIEERIREISSKLYRNIYEQESMKIKDEQDIFIYRFVLSEIVSVYNLSYYLLCMINNKFGFNLDYINFLNSQLFKNKSELDTIKCNADLKFLCCHNLYYENYYDIFKDMIVQNSERTLKVQFEMQQKIIAQQKPQEQPAVLITPQSGILIQQKAIVEQATSEHTLALRKSSKRSPLVIKRKKIVEDLERSCFRNLKGESQKSDLPRQSQI